MTPEEIERAVDLFYTNHPSRAKRKNDISLGIGLALCKEIAIRHNGNLKIVSSLKGDTTIAIVLRKERKTSNEVEPF